MQKYPQSSGWNVAERGVVMILASSKNATKTDGWSVA